MIPNFAVIKVHEPYVFVQIILPQKSYCTFLIMNFGPFGLGCSSTWRCACEHFTCGEVGVVKRVHTFLSGVHRLATALKVVEEVQEEVQEVKENEKKRKLDGMENSNSKSNAHCMHG